jgi:hypothetical protein
MPRCKHCIVLALEPSSSLIFFTQSISNNMPITTATTASKKAGAPAPQSQLARDLDLDLDMLSDLSSLSDHDQSDAEMETVPQIAPLQPLQPFPLDLRKDEEPSNIVSPHCHCFLY